MLVFIQYCEVLRHVPLHVIMSILCFVEMTDVIYCHVWIVTFCDLSNYSVKTKLYVLNLDCESVHVLNISALSDTCTLLFPQSGNSPLHLAALNGHLDIVELFVVRGADVSLCNEVSVIVNW